MGTRERKKADELAVIFIYHFGRIYYTFFSLTICTTCQMYSLT
jgi:hypothetical protein